MPVVELVGVSKSFGSPRRGGVQALREVSLRVEQGEFIVLLGPSGSGKTTLLRLIAGLEKPDAGSISMEEVPMDGVDPGDRNLAMVFSGDALYPHLSVAQNLAFGMKLRRIPKAEIEEASRTIACRLGMLHLLERMPAELSTGQRQRVALGRALALKPRLMLLDEPLSGLDPVSRAELRQEYHRILREAGVTVIHVTHDQQEAMMLADRIAVLASGEVLQVGTARELYFEPTNGLVARFLGNPPMNVITGVLRESETEVEFKCDATFMFAKMDLPQPITFQEFVCRWPSGEMSGWRSLFGKEVQLGFRPEDVVLNSPPSRLDGKAQHFDEVLVRSVEFLGSECLVRVHLGGFPVVARVNRESLLRAGDKVGVRIDPRRLHFFDHATGRRAAPVL